MPHRPANYDEDDGVPFVDENSLIEELYCRTGLRRGKAGGK